MKLPAEEHSRGQMCGRKKIKEIKTTSVLQHTRHTPTDLPHFPVRYPLFDFFFFCVTFQLLWFSVFQKRSRNQTLRVRVWQKRLAGTPKRTCWLDPVRMTPTSSLHSTILWPVVTTLWALPKVRGVNEVIFGLFLKSQAVESLQGGKEMTCNRCAAR